MPAELIVLRPDAKHMPIEMAAVLVNLLLRG
jgi:hypothetical protein